MFYFTIASEGHFYWLQHSGRMCFWSFPPFQHSKKIPPQPPGPVASDGKLASTRTIHWHALDYAAPLGPHEGFLQSNMMNFGVAACASVQLGAC